MKDSYVYKDSDVLINKADIKENAKYFIKALVMASLKEYAEYQYLQKILVDSIGEVNVAASSHKYKKIKDYSVEDYTYVYHKMK